MKAAYVSDLPILHMIRQALDTLPEPSNADSLGHPEAARLIAATRRLEQQLVHAKRNMAPPALPLPSADSIAAFVEGQATLAEQTHVTAAAVFDVGILFQLVSTVESQPVGQPPNLPTNGQVSSSHSDLQRRLLALRPSNESAPKSLQGTYEDATVHAADSPSASEPVGDTRPAGASIATLNPALLAPAGTLRSHKNWPLTASRLVLLLSLAACLLLGLGWIMLAGIFKPAAEGLRASQSPNQQAPNQQAPNQLPPSVEPHGAARLPPRESPYETPQPPTGPATASTAAGAGPTQVAALTPDLEAPTDPRAPSDPGASPGPVRPSLSSPAPRSAEAAISWRQVTGLLAHRPSSSYDRWQAVRLGDVQESSGSNHWMTLAGCFARGEFAGGGFLVLGEDTSLQAASGVGSGSVKLHLDYGTTALRELPGEFRLQFVSKAGPASSASLLEIGEKAELLVQREAQGLRIRLISGAARLGPTQLEVGTDVLLEDQAAIPRLTGTASNTDVLAGSLPRWAVQMPGEPRVGRTILASLAAAPDLEAELDRQIVQLGRNVNPSSPLGLANLEYLCRWRATLAVDEPQAATTHPLWPVRMAAFERMLLDANFRPAQAQAKRQLLGKVVGKFKAAPARGTQNVAAVSVEDLREWLAIVGGGREPVTRQTAAAWVYLMGDAEPEVAAFADFLLRKTFGIGPSFDPTSATPPRRQIQRLWTAIVAEKISP
jgi:hypothetical protein